MAQEFTVQDMTCGGCAASVRKAVMQVPGVEAVEIDLPTHRVWVEAPAMVAAETIASAIQQAGYTPSAAAEPKAKNNNIMMVDAGSGCGDNCCCG